MAFRPDRWRSGPAPEKGLGRRRAFQWRRCQERLREDTCPRRRSPVERPSRGYAGVRPQDSPPHRPGGSDDSGRGNPFARRDRHPRRGTGHVVPTEGRRSRHRPDQTGGESPLSWRGTRPPDGVAAEEVAGAAGRRSGGKRSRPDRTCGPLAARRALAARPEPLQVQPAQGRRKLETIGRAALVSKAGQRSALLLEGHRLGRPLRLLPGQRLARPSRHAGDLAAPAVNSRRQAAAPAQRPEGPDPGRREPGARRPGSRPGRGFPGVPSGARSRPARPLSEGRNPGSWVLLADRGGQPPGGTAFLSAPPGPP
jgi:hypothetical protein